MMHYRPLISCSSQVLITGIIRQLTAIIGLQTPLHSFFLRVGSALPTLPLQFS